jgi:hypothetical protein
MWWARPDASWSGAIQDRWCGNGCKPEPLNERNASADGDPAADGFFLTQLVAAIPRTKGLALRCILKE